MKIKNKKVKKIIGKKKIRPKVKKKVVRKIKRVKKIPEPDLPLSSWPNTSPWRKKEKVEETVSVFAIAKSVPPPENLPVETPEASFVFDPSQNAIKSRAKNIGLAEKTKQFFTNQSKKEITLFKKSRYPLAFKPMQVYQGLAVLLILFIFASFLVSQKKVSTAALINSPAANLLVNTTSPSN